MVRSHPQCTEYEVSIYSKVFCLWFTKSSVSTAELSLKLKPQANNIRICVFACVLLDRVLVMRLGPRPKLCPVGWAD